MPIQPASTIFFNNPAGRYLLSPVSVCSTFIIAKHVSKPMKSASVSGPIGTLVPYFMMLSISSLVPIPFSRHMIASFTYGMRIRLARKPGESVERAGILPMRLTNSMAVSMVSWDVCRPVMISTPFWTGTGFMKWVEITRDEADRSVGFLVVAAAILVMEMEDVFVARMACEGAISASWAKMDDLSAGISGTASITKSTSSRSERLVLGLIIERIWVAWSLVIRSFETSFSSSFSILLFVGRRS